jgi:hypothetical protein
LGWDVIFIGCVKKGYFEPVNEWYFGWSVCRLEGAGSARGWEVGGDRRCKSLVGFSKRARFEGLKKLYKVKCKICSKEMKKDQNLVRVFGCEHNLHEKCMDVWLDQFAKRDSSLTGLKSNAVFCPTCNKDILS